MAGSTTRHTATVGTMREPNQMSSSTMTQTTGVLLMKAMNGCSRVRTAESRLAATAQTSPRQKARRKPMTMRQKLPATMDQKRAVTTRRARVTAVPTGPTNSSSLSIARAANCQSTSQNATAPMRLSTSAVGTFRLLLRRTAIP